jgi:hypothetical protein
MSEYAGKQFVGIDLHRRRSVLVRTTADGDVLEVVRIVNDVDRLASVIARAGAHPRARRAPDQRDAQPATRLSPHKFLQGTGFTSTHRHPAWALTQSAPGVR